MSIPDLYAPPPVLTREQAMDAYRAVCAILDEPAMDHPVRQGQGLDAWGGGLHPVLCEDFEDRGGWAVVWEAGWDWSPVAAQRMREQHPQVFAEPWFMYALGLYVP